MKYDFEKFFDLSRDLLCILGVDGFLKRVNPSFERTLGWPPEEMTSRPFVDFIHPDDIPATLGAVERLAGGEETAAFENRIRGSDKSFHLVEWTVFPERETGLLFSMGRDTTALSEADRRFRMVMEASPAAMIMTDQMGIIKLVNREAERFFGYNREEMLGDAIELLVPQRYRISHQIHRAKYSRGPQTRPMGTGRDLIARHKDGTEFPVEIGLNPMRMSDDVFILCSLIDLTSRKETEEKILKLAKGLKEANSKLSQWASTDSLTDLKNRRVFEENLKMLVKLTHRTGSTLSVLLVGVDSFQDYNDRFGNIAGDEVLRAVARIIRQTARESDVVARYGGGEFALLLPDTSAAGAVKFGQRLRAGVQNHAWGQGPLSISVGAATLSFKKGALLPYIDYSARLLSEADRALRQSKKQGGGRITHSNEVTGKQERVL